MEKSKMVKRAYTPYSYRCIIILFIKRWNQLNMVVPTIFLFLPEQAVTIVSIMNIGQISNPSRVCSIQRNWMGKTTVYLKGGYLHVRMQLRQSPRGRRYYGNTGED